MDCGSNDGQYRLHDRVDANDGRNIAIRELWKQFDDEPLYRAWHRGGDQSEKESEWLTAYG